MPQAADAIHHSLNQAGLRTDVVVFTLREDRLMVLLVRKVGPFYAGRWALPGGFPGDDEDLDQCASRGLVEQTGLRDLFLEQLFTFGRPDRDPRGRIVSVSYYALAPAGDLPLSTATTDGATTWFPYPQMPPVAFDHREIIDFAHRRLVAKLNYSSIGFRFLPETFTLSEIQRVHETLLNRTLDKRNFRKRILALDVIEQTGRLRRTGKHRPAREYRLKHPGEVEIIK